MCKFISLISGKQNILTHFNSRLTCQRPNEPTQPTYTTNESTGKKEAVCNAVLTGKLGEYDGFTAIYNHVDKPSELKDGGGSGSHTWIIRAVVAVVVIILLIVTLWVLHGCYEKYSNVSAIYSCKLSITSISTF